MRVGTSSDSDSPQHAVEDHPHACGDKRLRLLQHRSLARIIPMRVGTSCWLSIRVYAYRDHPHACGDKDTPLADGVIGAGSSPCVWGQGIC